MTHKYSYGVSVSQKAGEIGYCRWWTAWQYGSQCQVLCLYCFLLHITIYYSFFLGAGMWSTWYCLYSIKINMLFCSYIEFPVVHVINWYKFYKFIFIIYFTRETKLAAVQLWSMLVSPEAWSISLVWVCCWRRLFPTDIQQFQNIWGKSCLTFITISIYGI